MKRISRYLFIPLAFLAALLCCSREQNPFTNYANAGLYLVHQSLHDGDTLQIFSTESLQVRVTVKELVERFSVSASANRLWPNPETTVVASQFSQEPFSFLVSFYDTGWQTLVTTVNTTNGDETSDTMRVYLRSPLHQDSVSAFARDTIVLRTPRVHDRDVTYYWTLGAGVTYASPVCSTAAALTPAFFYGRGCLWVWDGTHTSPRDSFNFYLRDTVKPEIACVNGALIRNDTIFTGDSLFSLRIRITDNLAPGVDSASVNGFPFDGKSGDVYYRMFDRVFLHPASAPLALDVYALDHFQNGNAARKTFWLAFSPSIPHAKKAAIVMTSPSADTAIVSIENYLVSGRVLNNGLDTLNLSMYLSVGGGVDSQVWHISDSATLWEWVVTLAQGDNPIRVVAVDNRTGATVDSRDILLFYTPLAPDSTPPRILSILADGSPAQGLYTDRSVAALAIEAVDDGTGVDTVYVNGKPLTSSGFWYHDTVPLAHTPAGNGISVTAIDKKKNSTGQSAVIFRNSLPVLWKTPSSRYILSNLPYTDTLFAVDPDRDTIEYQATMFPPALSGPTVDRNGVVTWTPGIADTGLHQVTIRIFDGYQPEFAVYSLYVFPFGVPPPKPVSFKTKAEDFPFFLVAGHDTMTTVLHVAQGTGIPPFAFSARVVGINAPLLADSTDSVLVWAPAAGDTGYHQLIATVKDRFPSVDTLYAGILVVPPDRPCSISVSYTADTLADGALRLDTMRQPFTLVFRVHDPDNPLVDRHWVTLYDSRSRSFSSFDSVVVDTFVYTVDPSLFTGYDTITATAGSKSNFDTIRVRLYFGAPPDTPVAVSPLDTGRVTTSSVSLVFSGHDPNGDTLAYDVYFGESPLSLSYIAHTRATAVPVSGLASNTTYYWRVVASNRKSQISSPLWTFTTGNVP
jgi:hypothetical protein